MICKHYKASGLVASCKEGTANQTTKTEKLECQQCLRNKLNGCENSYKCRWAITGSYSLRWMDNNKSAWQLFDPLHRAYPTAPIEQTKLKPNRNKFC